MSDVKKRTLSDISEHSGESPEAKKLIMSRMEITMPPEDAPASEWFKTLFLKLDNMYKQYDDLKALLDFNNKELNFCREEIDTLKKELQDSKLQTRFLECQNQDLVSKYTQLSEQQMKTEIHLRENNLVFDGIKETYGEHSGFLYQKIVQVFNHVCLQWMWCTSCHQQVSQGWPLCERSKSSCCCTLH
jgi:hypothetical protein